MSTSNLKQQYQKNIAPKLAQEFGLKNHLAAPRIEKLVINLGLGEGSQDKKILEEPSQVLALITGQKPRIAKARQSIAGFKLRAGDPIGLVVTLRGERMYNFLEKLIKIALPRLRDFKGISKNSFDHQGNYNLGIAEYSVFPEVDSSKINRVRGIQITLVTNTRDVKMAERLLELFGMPFEKSEARN